MSYIKDGQGQAPRRSSFTMTASARSSLSKAQEEQLEDAHAQAGPSSKRQGDAALAIIGDSSVHRDITAEEDRRVLRKIDLWLMPVILLVYFLQQLDK